MPLHRQRETSRVAHAYRLDGAIVGGGLDQQTVGHPIDALAVQRVDLDPLRTVEQRLQLASRSQPDLVGQPIALAQRLAPVGAMIDATGQLVHVLVQRTARAPR